MANKEHVKRVRTFAEASSEQDILSAEFSSFFLAELALELQIVWDLNLGYI